MKSSQKKCCKEAQHRNYPQEVVENKGLLRSLLLFLRKRQLDFTLAPDSVQFIGHPQRFVRTHGPPKAVVYVTDGDACRKGVVADEAL